MGNDKKENQQKVDKDKKKCNKNGPIDSIVNNYVELEKALVAQLNFDVSNHYLTIGGFREEIWKQLFEQIVPKKYVIEQSVFLIDSYGEVSNEVDLAIFDEMYTPYIFRNGRIKFIPIEAVAAVVQCKSTNVNRKNDRKKIKDWCASINQLSTSPDSVTRIASGISVGPVKTQSKTRPLKILCALKEPIDEIKNEFDFNIIAPKNRKKNKTPLNIIVPHVDDWDLIDWHIELNMGDLKTDNEKKAYKAKLLKELKTNKHQESKVERHLDKYEVKKNGKVVSILTLNLQLNQLLMLINNPMLFPHKAYVDMFNEVLKKGDTNGANTDNKA